MTSEINYYDSNYNYISPVRHFKSNDPYYYEVDNIPIKQLEESKNFLKDQVDGILRDRANFKVAIDRSGFTELQPFVTGSDRKVRVRAGRYTARVNDAYSISPLQFITQVAGFSDTVEGGTVADLNTYEVEKIQGTEVAAALDNFQQGVLGTALNMNGLAERTFTYPISLNSGGSGTFLSTTSIQEYIDLSVAGKVNTPTGSTGSPTLPNIIGNLYHGGNLEKEKLQLIRNVFTAGVDPDATQAGRLESAFIKRWRGAIRTSIVDVSGELAITVPEFDDGDFFYTDANGDQQPLAATQRIDLVFIYSKAIDQTETTLATRDPGELTNKVIRKPALGILKGAGMGISRNFGINAEGNADLTNLDGTPIMLAHPGDESGENTGFETSTAGVIRGSFPSPDDLLNLAPVLSENLETDSISLVGQSILPIAYIRVTNAGGTADILEETDIIDIRPFFRTTELAYNERAGIAAATPQISIANPVVSEAHLEKVRKTVFGTLNTRIDNLDIPSEAPSRVVGMGTVCGGIKYGPEGALFRQANDSLVKRPWNELADAAETYFNYLPGSITFDPGWDPAPWSLTKTPEPGRRGADHIHVSWPIAIESTNAFKYNLPPFNRTIGTNTFNTVEALEAQVQSNFAAMSTFGIKRIFRDEVAGLQAGDQRYHSQNVVIHFCRKVIRINRDEVPWMSDYTVNANLLNCIPLSAKGDGGSNRQGHAAGASNIWINKSRDYFVINVAWVANDFNKVAQPNDFNNKGEGVPWANRNRLEELAAFALPEIPIIEPGNFKQYPVKSREIPGEGPTNQGNDVRDRVNLETGGGTGLDNKRTELSYFTDVTPILYPSVSYEIIGHRDIMTSRSPKGSDLTLGKTPTIQLI
jgi:hypothetical protein